MRIGIGQINTVAADFAGNAQKILAACARFRREGADFAVFPELSLTGYSPKDAVFAPGFPKRNLAALEALASKTELPCLVGFVREGRGGVGRRNCAAWLEGGRVKHVYDKALLPGYDTFDEPRYFDPGSETLVVDFKGMKIAVTICEDIWTLPCVETSARYRGFKPLGALRALNFDESGAPKKQRGLDILVNISASVFSKSNDGARAPGGMLCAVSDHVGAPLVWCNLVGGNDELVFAGGSGVFAGVSLGGAAKSAVLKKFEEDLRVVDVDALDSFETRDAPQIEEIRRALVLGLRDFVFKSGFKKTILGLSGGLDSALVAALAAEALGAENVIGVSLPSEISSDHSREDARRLAENLGMPFHTVPISPLVDAANTALCEVFRGLAPDVAEENIQSRARGLVLMAMSNKFGAMLLSTGNKSECAVGYCTLYGDTCGGLAPISDLYKTEAYALARHINRDREIIPQNTIDKPPSAELRPGQLDCDSLPDYETLDEILRLFLEERLCADEIAERGFCRELVLDALKKTECAEYKRRQMAPGLKISKLAFGGGRRMPLARKIDL